MVILIYGLPRGETERHMEVLLAGRCRTQADIDRVKAAATADGWHNIRVTTWNGEAPRFDRVLTHLQ